MTLFQIIEKETISPTEIHLRVKPKGDLSSAQPGDRGGPKGVVTMRLLKIGTDWKYDGNIG